MSESPSPTPPRVATPAPEDTQVQSLLSNVTAALAQHQDEDLFTIGGKLSIPADVKPVIIRWDSKQGDSRPGKIQLPLAGDDASTQAFERLLKDCDPATFGRGAEDVYDESYRKAGKMDAGEFCSNFNPYEHGVIYTVNQALAQSSPEGFRGVRAELYNLNVGNLDSNVLEWLADMDRSTRVRLASSSLTSTRRDPTSKWAPLSSACPATTKVAVLLFVTPRGRLSTTGARPPRPPSNGQRSSPIASTRSLR